MTKPDRRIRKTRQAIFTAFLDLLNAKGYENITVQDIIDQADVGRSTFYAHYDSKETLLQELTQELFHHLFERKQQVSLEDYLAHLFLHFRTNQDRISSLLLSHNPYFLRTLRAELDHDLYPMIAQSYFQKLTDIPKSYLQDFVANHFIATVTWWLGQREEIDEKELVRYFLHMINHLDKQ